MVKWKCPILQNNEKTWIEIEEYDTSLGIVNWEGDYFPLITQDYIKEMRIPSYKIGNANSYLFESNHLNDFAVRWMEDRFSKY